MMSWEFSYWVDFPDGRECRIVQMTETDISFDEFVALSPAQRREWAREIKTREPSSRFRVDGARPHCLI
jgi:hypothetical protein